ncbi:MAG: LPS export ABC transporter periplasmic protein LptC [Calditrichaeota bacterium]|nr:LPS export ABC transporter periplasmic protein LptC [Calditrichota bacterium]
MMTAKFFHNKWFLTLIFVFSFAVACQKNEKNKAVEDERAPLPDQEAWNSTVTSTVDGKLNAVIHYGHMQRFKQRKVVDFDDGIEIDFYNEKGEHASKLTSERGKLNEASSDIEAFGNVVVVSDSGINLRTEHLYWDNSIEKVVSDTFVTITSADQDTFYGIGFESDQYLNNWVIRRISGKTSRGLDLQLEKKEKAAEKDSSLVDSTAAKGDAAADSLPPPRKSGT